MYGSQTRNRKSLAVVEPRAPDDTKKPKLDA
jgi:hypothetical protein